jgi:hypothetical protein
MERPAAPPEPPTPSAPGTPAWERHHVPGEPVSAHEWALFALAVVVCVAMLAFRRPDAFTAPWFYAEEGRDFLADAYRHGWASLGYRVNGYFHLYPRLVANLGLSAGVPVARMPWVNLVAVLLMYAVVWVYTFLRLPAGAGWRCIAVLCTVLVPLGNEVWMNMTNVQWPMALLIPLIVFGRGPRTAGWRVADGLVLLLACFTGPFALVLAPVILVAWWRRRNTEGMRGSRIHIGILVTAALAQALALAFHGNLERTDGPFHPLDAGFLQAAFFQLWYTLLSVGVQFMPVWTHALLSLVGIALLYYAFQRADSGLVLVRVLAWCALSLFIATLISYRGAPGFLSPFEAGIRNFYLPSVLLAWALACVPWPRGKRPIAIASVVLLWWVVQTVVFVGPMRIQRPVPTIDQAALDEGRAIDVPIDPSGWTMRLVPRSASEQGQEH